MSSTLIPIRFPVAFKTRYGDVNRTTSCEVFLGNLPINLKDDNYIELISRIDTDTACDISTINLLHGDVVIRQYTFPEDRVACFFEETPYRSLDVDAQDMFKIALLINSLIEYIALLINSLIEYNEKNSNDDWKFLV